MEYKKGFLFTVLLCCLFFDGNAQQGSTLPLDGQNDYVKIPHSGSLDITDAITIAAWVYLTDYEEYAPILYKGGNDDPNSLAGDASTYGIIQSGIRKGTAAGRLRIQYPTSGSSTETGGTVRRNTWTHIAATYNSSGIKVYFDGSLDSEFPGNGAMQSTTAPIFFGVEFTGGDEYWTGELDEIMLFNRALSESEINQAMNNQLGASANGLVGFWKFENITDNVILDSSPMGNNGLLFTDWVDPGPRPDYQAPPYPSPVPKTDISYSIMDSDNIPLSPTVSASYYDLNTNSFNVNYGLPARTNAVLSILNYKGQVIFPSIYTKQSSGYHSVSIPANNLQAFGEYIVRLSTDWGPVYSRVFVIQ